jgi:K+-transporting ATPase ATPase C chain
MLSHLRPALVLVLLFTLVTGLAYPLVVTGLAQLAFPAQARGSLVTGPDGHVQGSILIAQAFAGPRYLHPRGSSAGTGYDATSSSGSNLGPMDSKLADRIAKDAATLRAEAPDAAIPADAVTQSGSGLDPEISPQNALLQAPRVAKARHLSLGQVQSLIARYETGPALGFIGQPAVNVLAVNRELDRL